jgi:hypothetical protein
LFRFEWYIHFLNISHIENIWKTILIKILKLK